MSDSSNSSRWPLRWLGLAALPLYGCVAFLAEGFRPEADQTQPPLLAILILLGVACGIYLLALRMIARDPAASLSTVLFFSVAYRLILLPFWPIQEIDFYRYLWDGKVTLNGSNPYRYSPTQIDEAEFRDAAPAELTELRRLAGQTESVHAIFERVHYRDIPTAYPPVSQAVFALSIWLTPRDGSVWLHVMILKSVLLLFDLGTLRILVGLLRALGMPLGWALAYGWCPLALKEFANTGHLDTIAVFFTTLAIYLLISKDGLPRAALALGVLALGVLAKSYPIILLPLVGVYVARRFRFAAVVPLVVFAAVLVAGYLPFQRGEAPTRDANHPGSYLPFQRGEAPTRDANHPGSGVSTFLFTRWEMNDFLFALVYRNLAAPPQRGDPWFVLVPESTRAALNTRVLDSIGEWERLPDGADPAYLLALGVMGTILLLISLVQVVRIARTPEPATLLRACFVMLAWGWLLSSTQNPWYVLWALPLMPFAGRRVWFLMPCLALIYYLRFWFAHWNPDDPGAGLAIFDHVIVWLEYVPLFAALVIEHLGERNPRDLHNRDAK